MDLSVPATSPEPAPPFDLLAMSRPELALWLQAEGLNPAHAAALWRALHRDLVRTPAELAQVADLPAKVSRAVRARGGWPEPEVRAESSSADGWTRKFLLAWSDGATVETVLMRHRGRMTACLSTQVGCPLGCVFCATGQAGFRRNLSAGEIVAQARHGQRMLLAEGRGERLRNIVFMGMGEPLLNYLPVVRAAAIFRQHGGWDLSDSRITLSTVGVVPGIHRLAEENPPLMLAVSLHAATQEERAALLPAARKWPLETLMEACRGYLSATGRRIFYEWTLIAGRNDSPEQARALGRLLAGQAAQVNLIPLNPTAGFAADPTGGPAATRFSQILQREFGLPCTLRQRRGLDIAAGCGQLAGTSPHRPA